MIARLTDEELLYRNACKTILISLWGRVTELKLWEKLANSVTPNGGKWSQSIWSSGKLWSFPLVLFLLIWFLWDLKRSIGEWLENFPTRMRHIYKSSTRIYQTFKFERGLQYGRIWLQHCGERLTPKMIFQSFFFWGGLVSWENAAIYIAYHDMSACHHQNLNISKIHA